MSPALRLETATVRRGGRAVLDAVDLAVVPGELVGVVGANGSGKTTLMRAALGLQPLAAGRAWLGGRPAAALSEAERAGLAAYLPQERRVCWNLPAWRLAALGATDRAPAAAHAAALAALEWVGVASLAERGVLDMSGGERARVLLARLLVSRAPLLVADEPAAGLDPDGEFMALETLRARAAAGAAVIASLHDLTLAARTCDRLAVLAGGRLLIIAEPAVALAPAILAAAFALDGALIASPAGPVVAARRRRSSLSSPSLGEGDREAVEGEAATPLLAKRNFNPNVLRPWRRR